MIPPAETPTLELLAQQLEQLTLDVNKRVPALEKKVKATKDEREDLARQIVKKKAKIAMPPRYNGDPQKVVTWISQCRAYFDYYADQFEEEEDKALFAGSLLNGTAAMWFQPSLNRYTRAKSTSELSTDDQEIFNTFKGFERAITKIYGKPDGKRRIK